MTTGDGYRWVDRLIENRYARKSIKDVWVAALSATAAFMVERRKLGQNPFLRLKVRADKSEACAAETQQQPPRKGFTPEEAKLMLTATLATPGDLTSDEMKAARRWLAWLGAIIQVSTAPVPSLAEDAKEPGTSAVVRVEFPTDHRLHHPERPVTVFPR